MTQQLDATIVDAWMEFMSLREKGTIEDLDEKHRTIIYVVAGAEARGEKINQKCVLSSLGPRSAMPIISRINALVRRGFLTAEKDLTDQRIKYLRLTPKSIAMVNVLSAILKRVANQTAAVAAAGMMILLENQELRACLFAAEHLAS